MVARCAFNARVAGSSPVRLTARNHLLVVRIGVLQTSDAGSSPAGSTMGNPDYSMRLRKENWEVRTTNLDVAARLVGQYHYAKGGSNTATYLHGLFPAGTIFEDECCGVAWWIPPTKSAAQATYPKDWKGVLCLHRLVVVPSVPKNGASYLLGTSMRLIDRARWPCLVTYADTWQGHTGGIYRATNWQYVGETSPSAVYTLDGRMIARKAGPRTRTKQEMLDMGCVLAGRFSKHKYVHILDDTPS